MIFAASATRDFKGAGGVFAPPENDFAPLSYPP